MLITLLTYCWFAYSWFFCVDKGSITLIIDYVQSYSYKYWLYFILCLYIIYLISNDSQQSIKVQKMVCKEFKLPFHCFCYNNATFLEEAPHSKLRHLSPGKGLIYTHACTNTHTHDWQLNRRRKGWGDKLDWGGGGVGSLCWTVWHVCVVSYHTPYIHTHTHTHTHAHAHTHIK